MGGAEGRGARGARDVPAARRRPDSVLYFNVVFFVVLLSTLLQGTTFEALAARLGLTTNEPALPRPLAEAGTIRRLGAEILEYPSRRATRSRASACATSACRARRSST
jgi:NhaP-type Na+/H+ and K+/H+ antiporter